MKGILNQKQGFLKKNPGKQIQAKNSALKMCDFKNTHSIISDEMGLTLMLQLYFVYKILY